MKKIKRIIELVREYGYRTPLFFVLHQPWSRLIPDKMYLKMKYFMHFGKRLNLDNPTTFNEKMQWLKINDRKEVYTKMVDKIEAKFFVENKIGKQYVVPLYGKWDDFNDIDFESLPNQFVLKTTHGCGGMLICRDKSKLDIENAKKTINNTFHNNYFYLGREWPYKNVKPRILAEMYLNDGVNENLIVYKIFNMNGEPKIIQVIQDDKKPNETIDYFDTEWNLLNIRQNYPNSRIHLQKPNSLDKMLHLAKQLSYGIPFVRTDFYEVLGKIYFSEFTFYSDDGFAKFYPNEWDLILGNMIDLRK